MNILTDILSLFKRKQVVDQVTPEDLIVVGRHEKPDMLGIASPIPYKSVKLVKVKDLLSIDDCAHTNVNNGTGTNPVGIFHNKTSEPCSINLRSISGIGNNISVVQNDKEIEISTTGEPNTGINLGIGAKVFKTKVAEVLNFRTLISNNGSILIIEDTDQIDIKLNRVIINSPNGAAWEITIDNSGNLTTTQL